MNAALTLIKMRRFTDSTAFLNRIIAAYPGSQVAERAEKEKASIAGMVNEDEKAADKAKTDEKAAEAPAEDTKPAEETKK